MGERPELRLTPNLDLAMVGGEPIDESCGETAFRVLEVSDRIDKKRGAPSDLYGEGFCSQSRSNESRRFNGLAHAVLAF
jgi:hypothetical protein